MQRRPIEKFAMVLMVIMCSVCPGSLGAQSAAPLDLPFQTVSWDKLRFQGDNWAADISANITLDVLPAAAQATLLKPDQGVPFEAVGPEILHLSLGMMMNMVFNHPSVEIFNEVWFNPGDAQALGRYRLRQGWNDFAKTYRFTAQGVFRCNREPRDAAEARREPHQWADAGDRFYPYELEQLGCAAVTDRLLLIYIVSAAADLRADQSLALCVFGKRQLHRVILMPDGKENIAVDFVVNELPSKMRHQGKHEALKIKLLVEPLASALKKPENFSFLGLHKNIVIYIDPEDGLPLQISGKINKIASSDLKLRYVRYK